MGEMYTSSTFSRYGKMSESEEKEYRYRKKRRQIIIAVSTFLLLTIIIGATIGAVINNQSNKSNSKPSSSSAVSIKAACSVTEYPDSCYTSIHSAHEANATTNPVNLFKWSVQVALKAISDAETLPNKLLKHTKDASVQGALNDCKELFNDAIDRLNETIELVNASSKEELLTDSKIATLRSWLSATITDQVTCTDGLENTNGTIQEAMKEAMVNSTQYVSNSLAIATKILGHLSELDLPIGRKLLASTHSSREFPNWVVRNQRRVLLQDTRGLIPNVTVSKDGSVKTIKEALALVPKKNKELFLVYVKKGVYDELVNVEKNMWNVMMYGDGMYDTVVRGRLSAGDGIKTFATASFVATGRNFIARDMGFENTAGPQNHQAVALRSSSDFSLFYRCSFRGYQDTLYAHSLRQFYRECEIIGTIDFIFGDASAVFQNCTIMPRQPMPSQKNTITAQGRTDPNEPTGISIQGCVIKPFDKVSAPTYLGRPWKEYATTVVMQSEIDKLVDAAGWLEFDDSGVPPSKIFYGEFRNFGGGAGLEKRVDWPGYRKEISRREAEGFAVESFILGEEWIPATGIDFVGSV